MLTTSVTIPNTPPNPPAPSVHSETTQNQTTQSQTTSGDNAWITGILKSTYTGSKSQYKSQIAVMGAECRKAFSPVTPAGYKKRFPSIFCE